LRLLVMVDMGVSLSCWGVLLGVEAVSLGNHLQWVQG
jgi:hypothetical protein